MVCKKGHKDIAKHSINEDQSTEETGKVGTTVQCIFFLSKTVFTLIPVGFILGQAENRGGKEGGLNGGVVHFIAGKNTVNFLP